MKITKIVLQGFRAFDESFELDLDGGKNLLLHGENGSGKSSIYFALKRFFEERGDDIAKHRNHFSPDTRVSQVHLHIEGTNASGTSYDEEIAWNLTDGHPLPVPKDLSTAPVSRELRSLLVDAAHRAGFLDYRMMLRTHLLSGPLSRANYGPANCDIIYGSNVKGLEAQMFDLVSLVILAGVRVTTSGGSETTIGRLMRNVWQARPSSRRKGRMLTANRFATAFNEAFNAKLPELESKLAEFLCAFENHHLQVRFQPVALVWDKPTLQLQGAELIPEITFRGKVVKDYQEFLNEARLSAIATSIFFAGVALSDNDYANPAYPRFLVMDDALIGLDLQNRLPILRILASDSFKNYQIFLFTHDRVWFDLARGHLQQENGWLHMELLADEETGQLIPKKKASESDLEMAGKHLGNGDLKAAAVYTRSAFEWKLRNVCEKHGIRVPFKPDADKLGAGILWDGIVDRQRDREKQQANGSLVPDFVPRALETAVETMRSTVLNRLSHAGSSGLVHSEVAAAINTVQDLFNHRFPKIT